jgi:hypothetical protein
MTVLAVAHRQAVRSSHSIPPSRAHHAEPACRIRLQHTRLLVCLGAVCH